MYLANDVEKKSWRKNNLKFVSCENTKSIIIMWGNVKMRKGLIVGLVIALLMVGLTACKKLPAISEEVSLVSDKIEIGTTFNEKNYFECGDGVSIKLKGGNFVDTSKKGEVSAIFVLAKEKRTEEKEYRFEVIDTQGPKIKADNVSLYVGREFDPLANITCTDNSGEDINVIVKNNTVNTQNPGNYLVAYEASDSSGNSSTASVIVTVLPLNSAELVMDVVDEYLSKNGYSQLTYNKDSADAVRVKAPTIKKIEDANRTLSIRPEIYISDTIFNDQYKVFELTFKIEYEDKRENVLERYSLSADKLIICLSEGRKITVTDSWPEEGEYNLKYYLSQYSHDLSGNDLDKLNGMIEDNIDVVALEIWANDRKTDYSSGQRVTTPVQILKELDDTEKELMRQLVDVCSYLTNLLGQ